MSFGLKVRLTFGLLCLVGVGVTRVVIAVAQLGASEDRAEREQRLDVVFREIDRENAVLDCIDSTAPLNDAMSGYAHHFMNDDDMGARYLIGRTPPSVPPCTARARVLEGPDPWPEVATALDAYLAAREGVTRAMVHFRTQIAFARPSDEELDALSDEFLTADRTMSDADAVLHDALLLRGHVVTQLVIAELSRDPSREGDVHVARLDDAGDQLSFALHHAGTSPASRKDLHASIACFHAEVVALPATAGNALFQQRAHELDAAVAGLSQLDINLVVASRTGLTQVQRHFVQAYDQVSPRIGG